MSSVGIEDSTTPIVILLLLVVSYTVNMIPICVKLKRRKWANPVTDDMLTNQQLVVGRMRRIEREDNDGRWNGCCLVYILCWIDIQEIPLESILRTRISFVMQSSSLSSSSLLYFSLAIARPPFFYPQFKCDICTVIWMCGKREKYMLCTHV